MMLCNRLKITAASISLVSLLFVSEVANAKIDDALTASPAIQSVMNNLVKNHKFNRKELEALFAQIERKPDVVERMTRPAEGLPWHRYRQIFIKDTRIDQGVEFWTANASDLKRAESKFGVPAEIIVGIIGVETRFGRHEGGFRVVDSLATLAADFPRRSKFFSKELEEFILMTREEKMNPLSVMGSYAGAMGKPQFMPSSYREYAIDFDGDGVRDLMNSTADAIGSVASYLSRHGWQRDEAIAAPVEVSGNNYVSLVKKGMKPQVSAKQMRAHGVSIKSDFSLEKSVALLEFEQENGNEYWIGLKNFYVITRYNHSQLYAMAVYQLGESVTRKMPALTALN